MVHDKTVALHRRVFDRQKTIEHPAHRTYLLARTPNFKYQRIFQVMRELDPVVWEFLAFAREEGQDEVAVAYELFKLLKGRSKETLASACGRPSGRAPSSSTSSKTSWPRPARPPPIPSIPRMPGCCRSPMKGAPWMTTMTFSDLVKHFRLLGDVEALQDGEKTWLEKFLRLEYQARKKGASTPS